jgi:hypothetical protein
MAGSPQGTYLGLGFKNNHFSEKIQKPPIHPLTVSRNTDSAI